MLEYQNAGEALAGMFAGFPASQSDPVLSAQSYLASVRNVEPLAVIETAIEYRDGLVKGHNTKFAPSTAEFAKRCRTNEKMCLSMGKHLLENPTKKLSGELAERGRRWVRVCSKRAQLQVEECRQITEQKGAAQ